MNMAWADEGTGGGDSWNRRLCQQRAAQSLCSICPFTPLSPASKYGLHSSQAFHLQHRE